MPPRHRFLEPIYNVKDRGSFEPLPPANRRIVDDLILALPGAERLPASPAVAIWDQRGELAYFGPYSEGLSCNSSNSFIEPILEALSSGRAKAAAALGKVVPLRERSVAREETRAHRVPSAPSSGEPPEPAGSTPRAPSVPAASSTSSTTPPRRS